MATNTPNMNLIVPAIGVDTGLTWEQSVNTNSATVDQHNHTPGQGIAVPSSGLNINSQLPFNNNIATSLQAVQFQAQASFTPTLSLYAQGLDLYYNDGAGNAVQITNGGGVNVTSSGISSGTATASFVASVLVVNADTNKPANIQAGSILLGNNITASNYLTLQPPNAMPANYTLTLPTDPSGLSGSAFLLISPLGAMTAGALVDGTTIQFTSSALSVAPGGIGTTQLANGAVTAAKTTGVVSHVQSQTFIGVGPFSFVVPASVTVLEVYGYGGGGGGGSGCWNSGNGGSAGGAGGSGGGLTQMLLPVTPSETLTVNIGQGGAGGATTAAHTGNNGSDGGQTTIVRSSTTIFVAAQGAGGGGGNATNNPGVGGAGSGFVAGDMFTTFRSPGANGGGQSNAGNIAVASTYFYGPFAIGGATSSGFGGGGGGGSAWSSGGNGGAGATGAGGTGGSAPATGHFGAGGGGGGSNTAVGGLPGGAGLSGILVINWVAP